MQCGDPLGITVEIGTISGRSAPTCEKSEGLNFLALLAYQKITLPDEGFLMFFGHPLVQMKKDLVGLLTSTIRKMETPNSWQNRRLNHCHRYLCTTASHWRFSGSVASIIHPQKDLRWQGLPKIDNNKSAFNSDSMVSSLRWYRSVSLYNSR